MLFPTVFVVFKVERDSDWLFNVLQLIGKPKLGRLANLAKHAEISICVDNSDNLKDLSEVAQEKNIQIGVVVEVNVGQNR